MTIRIKIIILFYSYLMEINIIENTLSKISFIMLCFSTISYWFSLAIFKKLPKLEIFGRLGAILCNIILFYILLRRWVILGYFPLSNLYESLLFLNWIILSGSLYVEQQTKSKLIGSISLPIALLINGFGNLILSPEMQLPNSLPAALNSYWLTYHVSAMILSYGTLILGSILCLLFLVVSKYQEVNLQLLKSYSIPVYNLVLKYYNDQKISIANEVSELARLKLLQNLDNWSYRIIGLGFPFLTIGIIAGGVWANEAWGSYWSWDPKETWALITWIVFATYLHARITKGWGGKKAATLGSLGFFVIWICYLGVNFLGKGLHSYGWLN